MSAASRLLACVRLRARRHALWMEHNFARARTSPDQGLAITAGEVFWTLEDPAAAAAERATFFKSHDIAALAPAIAAADAALRSDPLWQHLCGCFAVPPAEANLLALAMAEALDPDFGRVIAYLNDDARQAKATARLAARLFDDDVPVLYPEALCRWRLVAPVDGQVPGLPGTAYQADPALLTCLVSGAWRDPALEGIAALGETARAAAMPVIHAAAFATMQAATGTVAFDLLGGAGSGRQVLAGQYAAAAGRALLVVEAGRVAASGQKADLTIACLRFARFTGAIMLIRQAEAMPDLPETLAQGLDMIRALPAEAITRGNALAVKLAPLGLAAREMVWRHHGAAPPPGLIATQRLTPGEIVLAAGAAQGGAEAMRFALRRAAPPEGEVLQRLDCPYGWDDLILPPELTAPLREFADQIRLRWPVYEEWGFGRLAHLGAGIAALFAGPSGTGKTMAAQVLARALELDLYRVDLAGVVNKYIGETEKRLRDVFAFGERAGAMLFFDEADALFGNRTEMKDAHDRFANIEIDYLLQRIERFDGITILATNRKSDIDTAFLRRLRFVVDFTPPGPKERMAIWRKALPETTPAGAPLLDRIDWHLLAERLTLNGADIKAAALNAAFLARAEDCLIAMRHVLAAVQREMGKRGLVMRLRPMEATGT